MTTEDQNYIEDQYFLHLCVAMLAAGADEAGIEENVHRIMDAWTFDGVLDTDSLDAIMVAGDGEVDDTPMGVEIFGG